MHVFLKMILVVHISATLCFSAYSMPDEGLSSTEVIEFCRQSMEPPLAMVVSRNGVNSLVYQKRLEGGVVAQRIEHIGTSGLVQISSGDQSFDLFPESKIALDSSIFRRHIKSTVGTILSESLEDLSPPLSNVTHSVTESEYSGSSCWVVTSNVSNKLLESIAKRNAGQGMSSMPSEHRYFVSKLTGMMLYSELRTANGRTLAEVSYTDIRKDQDLSDELFSVPVSWTVITPVSQDEYLKCSLELMMARKASSTSGSNRPRSVITTEMMERPWLHLGLKEAEFYKMADASRKREKERLVSNMDDSVVAPRSRVAFVSLIGSSVCAAILVLMHVRVYLHLRKVRKRKECLK